MINNVDMVDIKLNDKRKCLLCGATAVLRHDRYPGYQEPSTFGIFHCGECNTAFSFPRVEDNQSIYNVIYNNTGSVPGYSRYRNYFLNIKKIKSPLIYLAEAENTYWGILEALNKIIVNKKATKILEVGSGLGYLTYALNKDGFNTFGIDISETAVNRAVKEFGEFYSCGDLFEYANQRQNCYDVVIFTEVIEHINEPITFLRSVMKILKSDGYAILTTPNKSIYSTNAIWATDNPPVHCWWFSEESISYMGEKLNSVITFIDFSKFYKKHFTYLSNNPLPNTNTLDKDGAIIIKGFSSSKTSKYSNIKKWIIKIFPFIINIYSRLIYFNNREMILLKNRGPVLCAILQKSKQ
jgi:2-polyprenyl-3-methyl-5-hydroxy-6-metoxy-1,4-benzoquinol methylase